MAITGEDDIILVREVLAREIETINTYQTQQLRAQSEAVKAFLAHIMDEEKEHVAEALELIGAMDPVQARLLESGHVVRQSTTDSPATPSPAITTESSSNVRGFTVGSLRTPGVR